MPLTMFAATGIVATAAALLSAQAAVASPVSSRSLNHAASSLVARALPIGTCDASTSCPNGACCGSNGLCGYSPLECGAGCSSNCDAKAACGQYGTPGQQTCPLNVCCSQFGLVMKNGCLRVLLLGICALVSV